MIIYWKNLENKEQLFYSLNASKYFILHYYEDVLTYVKNGRQTNHACANADLR